MKTVFFDVDTQLDFIYPAGALYVPEAENIVENLTKLTRYAVEKSYPIIATMDAHSEDDPEFKIWKPHCVVGTTGQQKCAGTIAPEQIVIETEARLLFKSEAAAAADRAGGGALCSIRRSIGAVCAVRGAGAAGDGHAGGVGDGCDSNP